MIDPKISLEKLAEAQAQTLLELAIKEDQPEGDITTELTKPEIDKQGRVKVIAKEDLVLSGSRAFEISILRHDPKAQVKWAFKDGDVLLAGQIACTIDGSLSQLLTAERIALNFLGRLSGIATMTKAYVAELKGSSVKLLDTRKTTPGYRFLEKLAVRNGGGTNHRFGLSDAVLIKDNHIAMVGGIAPTLERATKAHSGPIEIEVDTLEQLEEAVQFKVSRVLLDNMTNEQIKQAVNITPRGVEIEVSGGITLERLSSLKDLGIHYVSVGAITHSAVNVDYSMEFDW